jgi:hypothetical protein
VCRGFGNRGTIEFVFGGGASTDSLRMVNHRDSRRGFVSGAQSSAPGFSTTSLAGGGRGELIS